MTDNEHPDVNFLTFPDRRKSNIIFRQFTVMTIFVIRKLNTNGEHILKGFIDLYYDYSIIDYNIIIVYSFKRSDHISLKQLGKYTALIIL